MTAPYQIMQPLSLEEFAALKADIAVRGVLVPVEMDEHRAILDGHHRVKACEELGAAYPVIVRPGLTEGEKVAHARALNACRRHLSPSAAKDEIERLRIEGKSVRAIAEAVGVSRSGVHSVVSKMDEQPAQVMGRDGIARGPRRPQGILAGSLDVAAAVCDRLSEAPSAVEKLGGGIHSVREVGRAVRKELRSVGREARAAALDETHPDAADRCEIIVDAIGGEIWLPSREKSVGLAIIDATNGDDVRGACALADSTLKDGGALAVVCHQLDSIDIQPEGGHLHLHWIGAQMLPEEAQGEPWHSRKVISKWRPVLIFVKGKYTGDYFADVFPPGMGGIVRALSQPADLVCDPLCNDASVGHAALGGARRFLGVAKDEASAARLRAELVGEGS